MNLEELNTLIDELIKNGEDVNEMQFWKDVFPYLSEEEQDEIATNLTTELEQLINSKHL